MEHGGQPPQLPLLSHFLTLRRTSFSDVPLLSGRILPGEGRQLPHSVEKTLTPLYGQFPVVRPSCSKHAGPCSALAPHPGVAVMEPTPPSCFCLPAKNPAGCPQNPTFPGGHNAVLFHDGTGRMQTAAGWGLHGRLLGTRTTRSLFCHAQSKAGDWESPLSERKRRPG